MNNTEDVELRYKLVKLQTEDGEYVLSNGFAANDIAKMRTLVEFIQQEANRQKLELLDRLETRAIEDGVIRVQTKDGGYLSTHMVSLDAIEAERKQLKEGGNL